MNRKSRTAPGRVAGGHRTLFELFFSKPLPSALVIFVFSLLLYGNTLRNDFVWDDRELIIENPVIRSLSVSTIEAAFTKNFWEHKERIGGYYRPLVLLSYNLDFKLFGMKPLGFHLTNILANAVVCLLLFLLLFLLFKNVLLGFLSTLIFAAIPLHTENVAWISARTDIFAVAWMFAALVLYIHSRNRRSGTLLTASLAAYVPALLSKEIAVVLPLIIVLVDVLFFRGENERGGNTPEVQEPGAKNKFLALAPVYFLIIVGLYFLVRHSASGTDMSIYKHFAPGALPTIALGFSIFTGYVFKLIFPFMLNAEYDAPVPASLTNLHALAGLVLFCAILLLMYRYRRKKEYVLGGGIFLLGIAPVLNFIPLGEISAERFLYFPSAGFALVVGSLFTDALMRRISWAGVVTGGRRGRQPQAKAKTQPEIETAAGERTGVVVILVFLVGLVASYSLRTVTRNADWRSEETIFTATSKAAQQNARIHLNMANVYIRKGQLRDAVPELEKAIQIKPDYIDAISNLAGVYKRLGNTDKALKLFERALSLAPTDAEIHNNLGTLYIEQKKLEQAQRQFEKALNYNPHNNEACFNLAVLELKKGDYESARRHFEKVKDMGERFETAYYYIGIISAANGENSYAAHCLEQFLTLHKREDGYYLRAKEALQKLRGEKSEGKR